jgi:hypothetical protein
LQERPIVRLLAIVALVLLTAVVAVAVVYVPRHDGQWLDFILGILLPSAGISWCLWYLVRRPPVQSPRRSRPDQNG